MFEAADDWDEPGHRRALLLSVGTIHSNRELSLLVGYPTLDVVMNEYWIVSALAELVRCTSHSADR